MANLAGVGAGALSQGLMQGLQMGQSIEERNQMAALRKKQEAMQDFTAFRSILGESDPALRNATLNQFLRTKNIDPKDPGIKEIKNILAKGDEQTLAALRDGALQGALQGLPLAQQLDLMKKNPLGVLEHKRKMEELGEQNSFNQYLRGTVPGPVTPQPSTVVAQGGAPTAGMEHLPMTTGAPQPPAPGTSGTPTTADPIQAKIENLKRGAAMAASYKNTSAVTFLTQQINTLEGLQKEQRQKAREIPDLLAKERAKATVDAETPKEPERISAGFADRMQQNEAIITGLKDTAARPGLAERVGGAIPLAGKELANIARPEERQKYYQAQEDWVRAKLRKESGAVIADEEMDREIRTYFPQIGDTTAVIAQKARARQLATQGMIRNAGRSYKRIETQGAQKGFSIKRLD
jgi:hypothetical protein